MVTKAKFASKLKKWLINFTIFSMMFVIMLMVGEGIIRFVIPQQLILFNRSDIWEQDDYLSWKHKPNINVQLNTGEREINFSTNEFGHRINSIEDYKKSKEKFDVISSNYQND